MSLGIVQILTDLKSQHLWFLTFWKSFSLGPKCLKANESVSCKYGNVVFFSAAKISIINNLIRVLHRFFYQFFN
jgi:hypothetical protein